MEATFTFTSTSVRPISGFATSRNSLPGADAGFTTASMVFDMTGTLAVRMHGTLSAQNEN